MDSYFKKKSKSRLEIKDKPDNILNGTFYFYNFKYLGNQTNTNNNYLFASHDNKSLFLRKSKIMKLINNRIISE